MEKRDILNYLGVKIGELELPDGTPEAVWQEKLAVFANPPPQPDPVKDLIRTRREFAEDLMQRFKKKNIESGINAIQALWLHHRTRELSISMSGIQMKVDLLNMVVSGDIECACIALQYAEPDDMTLPQHWLNQERINWLVSEMKQFLGWS